MGVVVVASPLHPSLAGLRFHWLHKPGSGSAKAIWVLAPGDWR